MNSYSVFDKLLICFHARQQHSHVFFCSRGCVPVELELDRRANDVGSCQGGGNGVSFDGDAIDGPNHVPFPNQARLVRGSPD